MVALDKQFDHHHGTKPQGRGRWRDESWQAGKFPDHRTAEILCARRPRDTSISSNTSCANEIIYCGYRFDPETQLYYVRNRTYNAVLGRWIERDPIGYGVGIDLYEYVESGPVARMDALGLFWPFSSQPTCQKWSARTPIILWQKEYTWTDIVRFRHPPANFRQWWARPGARSISQEVNFKVLTLHVVEWEIGIAGETGSGDEHEGTFELPPNEYRTWGLPTVQWVWHNLAHLSGLRCRKTLYRMQQCKCCDTAAGSQGGRRYFYVKSHVYGRTRGGGWGDLLWCDASRAENRLRREIRHENAKKKSICGQGTSSRPSGLRTFDANNADLGVRVGERPL